jgi:hypothetical protein
MKAAIEAARTQRAIFTARIDAHGLLSKVQIVRGGSGVYSGAGFQLQRGKRHSLSSRRELRELRERKRPV